VEERLCAAEKSAVSCGSSEQSAENVASALVGGENAVAYHECGASDMVGDNAQGDVLYGVSLVVNADDGAYLLEDILNGVDLEQVVNVLHYACETLQTHAGVDVLGLELGVVAVAVVVELGEYVVPDLDDTVAVADFLEVVLTDVVEVAVLLAAVVVYLRAGAAGTASVLPEVISLAELDDTLARNSDLVSPDVSGFVVLLVDGDPQALRRDLQNLGEVLPRPCDGFMLEVVAKREVAEHFEVSSVARGLADVLDIRCTNALLAGGDAVARRLLDTLEVLFQRGHSGVDEQDRIIPLRNQRKAVQAQVSLTLEETQVALAEIIKSSPFHNVCPLCLAKLICLLHKEYAYIFIIHLFRQKSIVKCLFCGRGADLISCGGSLPVESTALLCKNNKNKNEKSWRFVVDISALLCYNKVYKGADLLL